MNIKDNLNKYYNNLPEGIKKGVDACPLIIGIGPSAWPRIITSYYFPKFKTICLNDSQDDEFVRNAGCEVFSIKKNDPKIEVFPQTPGRIINTDLVKNYIKNVNEPFSFLVYKSSNYLEKVCEKEGWNFIGNKKSFMDIYENKKLFKEILRKIGVETIPGENLPIDNLTDKKFKEYQQKLGQKKLVLQLAEMTYGGGAGTFFIEDIRDLAVFRERVEKIRKNFERKKKKIETVNIAPFITGTSCSISCCATKKGVLTGPIQTQVIDIPEVASFEPGRSGTYAGTDWGYKNYSKESQKQADCIAQKFGDYIYNKGYKGIFGLDLIVEDSGKVWPVECNPRDTDAFPMVSMQMMKAGGIPLDVFHNLEHLGVDYDFDFNEINDAYKSRPFTCSQIIIENRLPSSAFISGEMKAGIYSFNNKGLLTYEKQGYSIFDLEKENQILITEGVPRNLNDRGYGLSVRIFRVIKKGKILEAPSKLTSEMKDVIEDIYKKLKLISVPEGVIEKGGVKELFINRAPEITDHLGELKDIDIINVIGVSPKGINRPCKIAWRKNIDIAKEILPQIPSNKTQKNIIYDLNKIKELGIEIKTYPEITDNQFKEWFALYKTIIGAKKNGTLIIDSGWLADKRSKGKKIGATFAVKDKKIVGGDLFFKVGERLSVGYGVAERMPGLRGGLMLLVDYSFLQHAKDSGHSEVSFGQDTDLYGSDLSMGLISYKTKLGFKPVPANNTFWVNSYFLKMDKFENGSLVFGKVGDSLAPIVVVQEKDAIDNNICSLENTKIMTLEESSGEIKSLLISRE